MRESSDGAGRAINHQSGRQVAIVLVNHNLLCHLWSDIHAALELIEAVAGRLLGHLELGFSAFPTDSGCFNSVLAHSNWN